MVKLRTGERADRVLRFINGLTSPRIGAHLARYGFGQADLDKGWALMKASVGERLYAEPNPAADPRALDALDSWENSWFPIAQATLKYEYPKLEQKVFLNIGQATGVEVMITVGTFIERFEALATGSAEEKAAHALLVTRGFDEATIGEAKVLLAKLKSVEPLPVPDPDELKRQQDAADEALWQWYLQWSAIARTAIQRGDFLRKLGFGGSSGSGADDPAPIDDAEPTPVAPI